MHLGGRQKDVAHSAVCGVARAGYAPDDHDLQPKRRLLQLPVPSGSSDAMDPSERLPADRGRPAEPGGGEVRATIRSSGMRGPTNCVVAIGCDGTVLHGIRRHWRLRVPFFGVNAGHLGFLLNDASTVFAGDFPPRDVIVRQLPLLHVAIEGVDGAERQTLAW